MNEHDWVKAELAKQMLENSKGKNIFPRTPVGTEYSTLILVALEKAMNITSHAEAINLLNKRVQLERSTLYIVNYLDLTSGRLQDSVPSKMTNSFFAGIPSRHPLSSHAVVTDAQKIESAKRIDESQEYYSYSYYNVAWRSAYHIAPPEVIYAGSPACRNIHKHNNNCELPKFTDKPPSKVSIYFLGFLVLKVSNNFSFLCLFYLFSFRCIVFNIFLRSSSKFARWVWAIPEDCIPNMIASGPTRWLSFTLVFSL